MDTDSSNVVSNNVIGSNSQVSITQNIVHTQTCAIIALYAATYGSGDEANDKDYGCPGGFDGERIETMEDLFLLTVFQIYTKLLLPNEG